MKSIAVLDKVKSPGIIAVDCPDGSFQRNISNLWSPDTEIAKSCVLDLSSPIFDPVEKRTWFDWSGKRNNGTITGASWKRTPSGIWYLSFDGVDDGVSVGTNNMLAATTGTVVWWAKHITGVTTNGAWWGFGDTDAATFLKCSQLTSTTFRLMCRSGGSDQYDWRTNQAITQTAWSFFCVTQNGTAPVVYQNITIPTGTWSNQADKTKWMGGLAGLDNLYMGCANYNSAGNAEFYTGYIWGLRIFNNRVLSVAEMTSIYNQEKHLFGL